MPQPLPANVQAVIDTWPTPAQTVFDRIRDIVWDVALDVPRLSLLETLKWGQPSWLPDKPRIGSTLRVAWNPDRPDDIGIFVNCNTTLGDTMRGIYPNEFQYEGARALYLSLDRALPEKALAHCAVLTLTYHRNSA